MGHGAHAVVTINPRAPKEHSVVVVNIRGLVYLVDAYNAEVILAKDLAERLRYGKSFEISGRALLQRLRRCQGAQLSAS